MAAGVSEVIRTNEVPTLFHITLWQKNYTLLKTAIVGKRYMSTTMQDTFDPCDTTISMTLLHPWFFNSLSLFLK